MAGTAGQILYFKTGGDAAAGLRWRLLGPSGDQITITVMSVDIGRVKLSANGTHTIEVFGDDNATGTYGFSVTEVP